MVTTQEQSSIESIDLHHDLAISESGLLLGNTDPRFGELNDVQANRAQLAGRVSCDRLVVMVAQTDVNFLDLDRGELTFDGQGYNLWPAEQQPTLQTYNPDTPPKVAELPTDGLITTEKGVGLMLNAADCMPIVLYDPMRQVLGLAHAGRRGAARDIAPTMLSYMQQFYGSQPHNVVTHFGASITAGSYVLPYLDPELQTEAWAPHIAETARGFALDIPGYVGQRLIESGILPENITGSDIDVMSHPDYFSLTAHKQNGEPNGRNGFVVAMRPEV